MPAALDRRTLEKIARSRRPGVLLRQLLDSLAAPSRRRARAAATYQRSLPIIQPAPAQGPLLECDLVRCRLGATLLVKRCLEFQAMVYPSGRRKGAPVKLECHGCAIGAAYRARLVGYEPPPTRMAPEVLPPAQRAAKALYKRTHVDEQCEDLAPLTEAAALTPEDPNDWRG